MLPNVSQFITNKKYIWERNQFWKKGKTMIYIPRYIIDQEATKWYLLDKLCLPPVQFIMVARNKFVGGQSSKFYQTSQTVMILSISTAEH